MAITTIIQSTEVDGINSLVVSSVVQNTQTNQFERTITCYDENNNVMFTLIVTGATQANVELAAPAAEF